MGDVGVTACPACGERAAGEPVRVPDREYRVPYLAAYATCPACASLFQRPMPDGPTLAAFYPADYHSQTGQGPVGRFRHDARLRRLGALAGADGPVLDYGCGNGAFLVRAAERVPARRYYGFEIAEERDEVTLAGGAVTLIRGDLDWLLDRLPTCRVITMNHVIEHLPDPLSVLSLLCAKLAPGGLLEGQTPAAGSLEHRVFGRRWSGYHAPRHTVVFSPTGLARLLARAGLEDVDVRGAFNPAGLAVSLASLAQTGEGGRVRRSGPAWLVFLGVATLLSPVDRLSSAPAIVDFAARKRPS
jgi:SAM-dependent methyltransferase